MSSSRCLDGLGWMVALVILVYTMWDSSLKRTELKAANERCSNISGTHQQLYCFECHFFKNFPLSRIPAYPFEENCLNDPSNYRKCGKGEYCTTRYHSSPDGKRILIKRYCYMDTSDTSGHDKFSCQKGVKKGLNETICNCNSNKCLPFLVYHN